MKKWIGLVCLLAAFVTSLSTSYSSPIRDITGKWNVKGKISNGGEYTGSVKIKKTFLGKYKVYGRLDLITPEREKIASFNSRARFDGKTLRFSFYIRKTPSVVNLLYELARGEANRRTKRIKVKARYTLDENKRQFVGGWKAGRAEKFSGQDVWTQVPKKIEIHSITPKQIEISGDQDLVVTVSGRNLPTENEITPKEVHFFFQNKIDEEVKVTEILETNDDGTSMKLRLKISSKAFTGKRDIQIKKSLGRELFEITRGVKKLPLGGSAEIVLGDRVRIFIPQKGGELALQGLQGIVLHYGSQDGEKISPNDHGNYEIQKAGWYYLDFSSASINGSAKLSSSYKINGKTAEDKMPWNFWYFPFYQKYNPAHNLYSDGGVYEKLDKIFKIKGDEEGWKKFNPYRHMDKDYKDSRIQKLAKKYYKGFKWSKPEKEEDLQFLKKHNPTTIKGYAWCYQRSEDPNKSWWGHCWGAVVASSLWTQPEATTITLNNGEKVSFSEEEAEGIITSYYTNHSVYPTNYLRDCPAGRPTEKTNEPVDSYCDDFYLGLIEGIKEKGLPLASNLRAEATDDASKGEVWNHVIWKFESTMKEVDGDETYVEVQLTVYATNDVFPSYQYQSPRKESYTFRLKYNSHGTLDRDNRKFQNWISASHFCPSYLWRINRSAEPEGTENAVLRGKIDKLVELFHYKRIE